jgi:hypothetical protein
MFTTPSFFASSGIRLCRVAGVGGPQVVSATPTRDPDQDAINPLTGACSVLDMPTDTAHGSAKKMLHHSHLSAHQAAHCPFWSNR